MLLVNNLLQIDRGNFFANGEAAKENERRISTRIRAHFLDSLARSATETPATIHIKPF